MSQRARGRLTAPAESELRQLLISTSGQGQAQWSAGPATSFDPGAVGTGEAHVNGSDSARRPRHATARELGAGAGGGRAVNGPNSINWPTRSLSFKPTDSTCLVRRSSAAGPGLIVCFGTQSPPPGLIFGPLADGRAPRQSQRDSGERQRQVPAPVCSGWPEMCDWRRQQLPLPPSCRPAIAQQWHACASPLRSRPARRERKRREKNKKQSSGSSSSSSRRASRQQARPASVLAAPLEQIVA